MDESKKEAVGLFAQIFERFFEEIEKDPQLVEVEDRLRKVVLEDNDLSETSIRTALLSDELIS